ncbi:MAG: hypothetical protein AB8I08_17640 [Sandaracinaceae bacterium]
MGARVSVFSVLLAGWVGGCTSAVVGAECREGFEVCDGMCVELSSDALHCGACGVACAPGEACREGTCGLAFDGGVPADGQVTYADGSVLPDGALPDGALPDGALPDGALPDGALPDGSVPDGGLPDGAVPDGAVPDGGLPDGSPPDGSTPDGSTPDGGGPTGCDLGQTDCSGLCVRTDIDRTNCGGCGVVCPAGEVCDDGTCRGGCLSPRVICDDGCVDPGSDPDHCGGCDQPCPSGVCFSGMCSGPLAGHLVLVGHDYEESRSDMRRVAGNAVHLGARAGHTRVLVYEGHATSAAIVGVDAAIDQVSTETARTWTRVVSLANDVPAGLADADTFVVYAQNEAVDTDIDGLGAAWGVALNTFLRRGGVVVVFDGMGGNRGTYRLLVQASLLRMSGRLDVTSTVLDVVAPGDAVALGVPLRYRAEASSVRFLTDEGETVVAAPSGPVVIHRTVIP